MALQVIYGDFDRLIVDPFVARVNRVSGPVKQSVTFTEASIQFNLTGGKTWHRLAPFFGATIGLSFPSQHAAGHQRLRAGTQGDPRARGGLPAVPDPARSTSGPRPGRVFWKLNYPPSFTREPPHGPGHARRPATR